MNDPSDKEEIEKVTEDLINYFKAKKDQSNMLHVFNQIKGLLGISGNLNQKDGKIYLEKAK